MAGEPERFAETIKGTTVSIEMIAVPAGMLEVDDPAEPSGKRQVKIAPFWMSETEVTWDAFDAFVYSLDAPDPDRQKDIDAVTRPSKPYVLADRGYGHAGYPAISVSYASAKAFADWLSARSGKRFRVPTEEEWEYACRAGAKTDWSCGADPTCLDAIAWTKENSGKKTHPCGSKAKNAFGIFDLHGNAGEYALKANGKPTVCGGSFKDAAKDCAATSRKTPVPAWNANDPQVPKSPWWLTDGGFVGFRIVCEKEPEHP